VGIFRRAQPSDDGGPRSDEGTEPDEQRPDEVEDAVLEDDANDVDDANEPEGSDTSDGGPWDVDDVPERGTRLDLGAIWLPGREGMALRMETNESGSMVTAVSITLNGSSLQVQAFAAPRSDGIWDEIRSEIGESVTKQGGSADDLPGPFGRELLARLPVRNAEGRTSHRPARFIGADGPRWFLRGVVTGRAAVDPEAARELEEVFADVVVVRGPEARAPRELLPLALPNAMPVPPSQDGRGLINPFDRGPEITEVY
jgi:hypothetical protein